MSYSFTNRYCKLTANLPETGIITITGWIILADKLTLLMMDEYNNHTLIKREQLMGSIVVMEKQKQIQDIQIMQGGVGEN